VQAGLSEVVERWPAAVGPAIAQAAWPARIGRDGTVHVHTADSTWAFELGHRAAEIAARLGVDRVRFAPGPLPSPAAEETSRARVEPSPEDEALAAALSAAIGDPDLRESVEKAIAFSVAAGPRDRSV
jgi:hypothetical protein